MRIFKIYSAGEYGFEENVKYCSNYNKSIQLFNDLIRKELKSIGNSIIDKEYWGEEIQEFKDSIEGYDEDKEIICRSYPVIIYKTKSSKIVCNIPYSARTSYEYDEWDTYSMSIIIDEIEVEE